MAVADETAPPHEPFMRRALDCARRNLAAGAPPVGACLVRDQTVLAVAGNGVIQELDATAHAEIQVIRAACRAERQLQLVGAELYVTVEPCAMCLAASFYAGLRRIFFGAPLAAMGDTTGQECGVAASVLFAGTDSAPQLAGGVLEVDSRALLEQWAQLRERSQ